MNSPPPSSPYYLLLCTTFIFWYFTQVNFLYYWQNELLLFVLDMELFFLEKNVVLCKKILKKNNKMKINSFKFMKLHQMMQIMITILKVRTLAIFWKLTKGIGFRWTENLGIGRSQRIYDKFYDDLLMLLIDTGWSFST